MVVVLPELAMSFEMKKMFFYREVFGIDQMLTGVSRTVNRLKLHQVTSCSSPAKEIKSFIASCGTYVGASRFRLCFVLVFWRDGS